jgi:hypothetical protein
LCFVQISGDKKVVGVFVRVFVRRCIIIMPMSCRVETVSAA